MSTPEEQRLLKLINLATSPTLSNDRKQQALNRLIITIQKLPGIHRSSHPLYLEAANKTWIWLAKNIHNFAPNPYQVEASLVKWVNGNLYWRLRDLYQPSTHTHTSLDHMATKGFEIPTLSGLETYIEQEQQRKKAQDTKALIDYILTDPHHKLRNCHPTQHPHCHGQILVQRLLLQQNSDSLTNLAEEFQIKYQTLASHWKRKVLKLLREITLDLYPDLAEEFLPLGNQFLDSF